VNETLRYLVRVKNEGRKASQASIAEMKTSLSEGRLPRHENFRVSRIAVEFDLYEDSPGDLERDVRTVVSALGPVLSVRNLSAVEGERTVEQSVELAKAMYSEERFWEVHEELESQWRKFPKGVPEKEVLQGLILLAAAYVHLQKGEEAVALSILGRVIFRLGAFGGSSYHGLDISSLKRSLNEMEDGGSVRLIDLPLAV
jgi:predicted metal-dependent hydrolase